MRGENPVCEGNADGGCEVISWPGEGAAPLATPKWAVNVDVVASKADVVCLFVLCNKVSNWVVFSLRMLSRRQGLCLLLNIPVLSCVGLVTLS